MTNLLSPSIEKRATELILQGVDVIEAVKTALVDEMNMIGSLLDGSTRLTERGEIARDRAFDSFMKNAPTKQKKIKSKNCSYYNSAECDCGKYCMNK